MKPLEIQAQCGRCGTTIGKMHYPGCSIERCPECGRQMISCDCCYKFFCINVATMKKEHPNIYRHGLPKAMAKKYEYYIQPRLIPWDGIWPGVRECREYGLWSKMTEQGWESCSPDDPDASEDLNTLNEQGIWDKEQKRFIIRG